MMYRNSKKKNDLIINVYSVESEFTSKKSEKSTIILLYLSNFKSEIPAMMLLHWAAWNQKRLKVFSVMYFFFMKRQSDRLKDNFVLLFRDYGLNMVLE